MLPLSAFADEISADFDEQLRVCVANGVRAIELRGAYGKNVMDFDADLRQTLRSKLRDAGVSVVCIGSPIGKVPISRPWEEEFDRFKAAVEIAEFFSAKFVRVFSYYEAANRRDEVVDRFREKVDHLKKHDVALVHENERNIFGEKAENCFDLLSSVNSPTLRCAFDFANFVQVGEDPVAAWQLLREFVVHFHIKDARRTDGGVVPAGEGDGRIGEILADAWKGGYRGFLSLEPHLKIAGHSHGETGEELFGVAVAALRKVCGSSGVPTS